MRHLALHFTNILCLPIPIQNVFADRLTVLFALCCVFYNDCVTSQWLKSINVTLQHKGHQLKNHCTYHSACSQRHFNARPMYSIVFKICISFLTSGICLNKLLTSKNNRDVKMCRLVTNMYSLFSLFGEIPNTNIVFSCLLNSLYWNTLCQTLV